jgi:hypothetical protein
VFQKEEKKSNSTSYLSIFFVFSVFFDDVCLWCNPSRAHKCNKAIFIGDKWNRGATHSLFGILLKRIFVLRKSTSRAHVKMQKHSQTDTYIWYKYSHRHTLIEQSEPIIFVLDFGWENRHYFVFNCDKNNDKCDSRGLTLKNDDENPLI